MGYSVWFDGANAYYSSGTDQYVYNKATSTWVAKSWNGLTNFFESSIWSDGTNIYCANDYNHYVLNKSTGTWTAINWSGLTDPINGENIWTDGTNYYYSYLGVQYKIVHFNR